jgi:putative sugar O-methyltransferase
MPILDATRKLWRKLVRQPHVPALVLPVEEAPASPQTPAAPSSCLQPPPLFRVTESLEQAPENESDLVAKLLVSYQAARKQVPFLPPTYLPHPGWGGLLDREWRGWREVIARGDTAALAGLLRNFFRNEGLSGFWGSDRMFQIFRDAEENHLSHRPNMMLAQFRAWRRFLPDVPLEELDAPRIGNPWGYRVGTHVLYEPVLEYNYQAHYFQSLLSHLRSPVVLEIGGGFGGLAYQILKRAPATKYIGFDLPENALVQAYYLSCAFPRARILIYDDAVTTLDASLLDAYDAVLLPNFMLPRMASDSADLIVNSRSLSEMSAETIADYLQQIDRIGRLWFFHENIFKPRGDGIDSIPSSEFPPMANHLIVASWESRWPRYNAASPYPCQENLFLHRGVLAG